MLVTVLASTSRPLSSFRRLFAARGAAALAYPFAICALTSCGAAAATDCAATPSAPACKPTIVVQQIVINEGNQVIERGLHKQLTTTIVSSTGLPLDIAKTWTSSNDKVASVDVNGLVTAVDTGSVLITATSLGVKSIPIVFGVGQLLKSIDLFQYAPLSSNSPGVAPDSLRVIVTSLQGPPLANRKVAFAVTGGGGTVSPATATTNAAGIAATALITGPTAGLNTVTATLLSAEDKPIDYIRPNFVTFTLRTFDALTPVAGNNQNAVILSALPIEPSVKIVDSLGKPRAGIPVTFAATSGGKVQSQVVATGADGTASPGVWTLGDIPGEQQLVATVENSKVVLKATGTGTPIYFKPSLIAAGQNVTCAGNADGTVSCFGEQPKVGDSTKTNRPVPTPTYGGIKFTSVTAGINAPVLTAATGHVCAIATDKSLYCWGALANMDTAATPVPALQSPVIPTRYPSDLLWVKAAPAQAHNCALATDQNIYCWGDNSVGQLGDRGVSGKNRYTPAAVFGGFKFSTVTSGGGHTCGLALDGSAFCWGYNVFGQLGNGTVSSASSPTAVSSGITFKQISAGDSFVCGITALGATYCWGNLGAGGPVVSLPRTYAGAPNFASITSGAAHTCALTADGSAYCWGDNSVGQLGDSTTTSRANPTAVATTVKFKSISAGTQHTCGIGSNDAVLCWGLNKAGELGDSVTTPPTVRKQPRYIVLGVTPPAPAGFKGAALIKR